MLIFFASSCVSSRSWPFKMGWICTLSDIFGSLVLLTFALILVKWIWAVSSAHQFFTDSFREITILRQKRTLCDSARICFLRNDSLRYQLLFSKLILKLELVNSGGNLSASAFRPLQSTLRKSKIVVTRNEPL